MPRRDRITKEIFNRNFLAIGLKAENALKSMSY